MQSEFDTWIEGRQGNASAAVVESFHHSLEPAGVEHGHHLHLGLVLHAKVEGLHLEDVGHIVGVGQLHCFWPTRCAWQYNCEQ